MKCLVMDFGGTFLKYSLMDHELNIYEKGEKPSPNKSVEEFVNAVSELYEIYKDGIEGIAISMPGFLDADTGFAKTAGAFIPLYGQNIYDLLKEKCPVPVTIENDGKCGALAEAWVGNLKDCKDGVAVILGTGVAGGIIKDRRVHRGNSFAAGEFSYLIMQDGDGLANSATFTCGVASLMMNACLAKGIDIKKLPVYALFGNFIKKEQVITECDNDPEFANGIDGYKFFELLEKGDEVIKKVYEEYTFNVAKLAFTIQVFYDPEKIVIGGGISRQKRLISDIQEKINQIIDNFAGFYSVPCTVDVCRFLNEANQYGALYNFLTRKAPNLVKEF